MTHFDENGMGEGAFSSPMDEVFALASSTFLKRSGMDITEDTSQSKRKCEDDSGYASPPCSSSSILYTPVTSDRPCDYHAPVSLMLSSRESDKINHETSPSEVESYSEFFMDTSLYYEPMDVETPSSLAHAASSEVVASPTEAPPVVKKKLCLLEDLQVTPLPSSFSSPRRKPFLNLSTPYERKSKRLKSLNGLEKVDFLSQFCVKSHYPLVVSKIFSYLLDSDLAAVTMVSKNWRKICLSDPTAKNRWCKYVESRKMNLENLPCSSGSSKLKRNALGVLNSRTNHSTPLSIHQPSSPPVSPSKARFHMFLKEAKKLKEDEILMHCPRCRRPSVCSPSLRLGECSSPLCRLRFCTLCRADAHTMGRPCPSLIPSTPTTPTKPSRPLSVGSKQSRRNLRRL